MLKIRKELKKSMTSKFELSISTEYVPDWGLVEAFRELFQNALDNESVNPENKMGFEFKAGTVKITNKTSVLPIETLLLGNGTKHDDERTIGKHGEGYKIAFMVLLRNNKKIKVYNYGAREIWQVRLVKSKRYNGQLVPTVFVEKEAIWKKTPSNDLTIEVSGITDGEYEMVKEKNLHLRKAEKIGIKGKGSILFDNSESGNIYVSGLFVSHLDTLQYGYDFNSSLIQLDRDRKLVQSFDVQWNSSAMWNSAAKIKVDMRSRALQLVIDKCADVQYVDSTAFSGDNALRNAVAEDFYEKHGANAVPVTNNKEFMSAERTEKLKPVIVDESYAQIIRHSDLVVEHPVVEEATLKERFEAFVEKIESKLTDEELDELNELISEL